MIIHYFLTFRATSHAELKAIQVSKSCASEECYSLRVFQQKMSDYGRVLLGPTVSTATGLG